MIKDTFLRNSDIVFKIAVVMIAIFTAFYIDVFIVNYIGYIIQLSGNFYTIALIVSYFSIQIITFALFFSTQDNGDLLLTFAVHIASCLLFAIFSMILDDVTFELQLIFIGATLVFFIAYANIAIASSKRILYIHTFPKLVFITTLIVHAFMRDNHHFVEYTFLLVPLSDFIFFVLAAKVYQPSLQMGLDLIDNND